MTCCCCSCDLVAWWHAWLLDSCFSVERGARYLDSSPNVSYEVWAGSLEPCLPELESQYGVSIRYLGGRKSGVIHVAKYPWVFDLADVARDMMGSSGCLGDALYGVLLGYDADHINDLVTLQK